MLIDCGTMGCLLSDVEVLSEAKVCLVDLSKLFLLFLEPFRKLPTLDDVGPKSVLTSRSSSLPLSTDAEDFEEDLERNDLKSGILAEPVLK